VTQVSAGQVELHIIFFQHELTKQKEFGMINLKAMRIARAVSVALACVFCNHLASQETSQENKAYVVAVLEPTGDANKLTVKAPLEVALGNAISANKKFKVVRGRELAKQLKDLENQLGKENLGKMLVPEGGVMIGTDAAKAIGKGVGAHLVCVSHAYKKDGQTQISAAVISVVTGVRIGRSSPMDSPRTLENFVKDLVSELLTSDMVAQPPPPR